MKNIKTFESYDNEEYVNIEITLNPKPISHSFEINKEKWESLSEIEQKNMVEESLIELIGEENIETIENGKITYFAI